jgi:hypothetical protein
MCCGIGCASLLFTDTSYVYTISNTYPKPLTFFGVTLNTNDTMIVSNPDQSRDWIRIMILLKQGKLVLSSNKIGVARALDMQVLTNLNMPLWMGTNAFIPILTNSVPSPTNIDTDTESESDTEELDAE